MDFYWFGIYKDSLTKIKELEDHSFSGLLCAYGLHNGDFFTRIAKYGHQTNLKYMVAIRPYAISPQYLCMINNSLNEIIPNQLEINFVSGWSYEPEKEFGGIIGPVNDLSSSMDKNNYLMKYLETINNMKDHNLNFYVSTTNQFIYNMADNYNNKIIVPYSTYMLNIFDITNNDTMIHINPILRETTEELNALEKIQKNQDMFYFTYNEFEELINKFKEKNIKKILVRAENPNEKKFLLKFVKQYKEKEIK